MMFAVLSSTINHQPSAIEYMEYAVVGILVAAAAVYAFYRLRRALQGREGCSFTTGDGSPCQHCPGACGKDPSHHEGHEERQEPTTETPSHRETS